MEIPEKIGRYVIESEIGRGAMGVVYRAVDEDLDRPVAVKMLPRVYFTDEDHAVRFKQEARIVARLDHPNIMRVYSIEYAADTIWIIMEFLEGRLLSDLLRANGKLFAAECLRVTEQIAHALGYAHKKGVVHRDIKPSNVMVHPEGRVKIMDFGIARDVKSDLNLTRTGTIMGTPRYMAPEQFEGTGVDARSDAYSLGIMAYEMLCGEPPFQGSNVMDFAYKHIHESPPPLRKKVPDAPLALDRFIDRCLRKNKEDRPSDLSEIRLSPFDSDTLTVNMKRVPKNTGTPGILLSLLLLLCVIGALVYGVRRSVHLPRKRETVLVSRTHGPHSKTPRPGNTAPRAARVNKTAAIAASPPSEPARALPGDSSPEPDGEPDASSPAPVSTSEPAGKFSSSPPKPPFPAPAPARSFETVAEPRTDLDPPPPPAASLDTPEPEILPEDSKPPPSSPPVSPAPKKDPLSEISDTRAASTASPSVPPPGEETPPASLPTVPTETPPAEESSPLSSAPPHETDASEPVSNERPSDGEEKNDGAADESPLKPDPSPAVLPAKPPVPAPPTRNVPPDTPPRKKDAFSQSPAPLPEMPFIPGGSLSETETSGTPGDLETDTVSAEDPAVAVLFSNDDTEIRKTARRLIREKRFPPSVLDALSVALDAYRETPRNDALAIDAVSWCCKALGAAGDPAGIPALERILSAPLHRKIKNYADGALRSIYRNPEAKGLNTRDWTLARLRSGDYALVRETVRELHEKKEFDRRVLDQVGILLSAYLEKPKPDRLAVDAVSWCCILLGDAKRQEYAPLLKRLSGASVHRKINAHAAKALSALAPGT